MDKDFVSFEVAKLLRENGFNEPCYSAYDLEGNVGYNNYEMCYNTEYDWAFSRPTLYEAQKWLRESKNLNIMVDFDESILWWYSIRKCKYNCTLITGDRMFNSYEEALNTGILEALKMIWL